MIYKIGLELEGAELGISATTYNVDKNTWALIRDALEGRIMLQVVEKEAGQVKPGPESLEEATETLE